MAHSISPLPEREHPELLFMAAEHRSVGYMARKLCRDKRRIELTLDQLLGKPYEIPAEVVRERRRSFQRAGQEAIANHLEPDHLAHCLAVLNAEDAASPKGCGYPVANAPALVRIAA